jgi:hypothetical protein
MTRKLKYIVALCSLAIVIALALAGAVPYGYFVLAIAGAGGATVSTLCWALYLFVALLLWLCIWRVAYVAVQRRPERRQ